MNFIIDKVQELKADQLYIRCSPELFDFETTRELKTDHAILGQDRVTSSVDFGIQMKQDGYNIFALGPRETDKKNLIKQLIEEHARKSEPVCDWCYVNNFSEYQKPNALKLPAGKGVELRDRMATLVEELQTVLTSAFESEEYQNRRQSLDEQLSEEQGQEFKNLREEAENEGITLVRTPFGYSFAPVKDDEILSFDELEQLPDKEKERLEKTIDKFQEKLQKILRKMPVRKRKFREHRKKLNREITDFAVKDLIDEIRKNFEDLPEVDEFLDEVHEDIIENASAIIAPQQSNPILNILQGQATDSSMSPYDHPTLWRYLVNVIVNNAETEGAPVIYEDKPTYANLIGKVEHISQMGMLSTDFTLIKGGALHRANGGYLILDVRHVLLEPFAWEGLKRVLMSSKLKIESPGESLGLISTVSLEPEPMELNVRVVLLGERLLYYLLCEFDPDFKTLFKVEADFDDDMDRSEENQQLYAQLIARLIHDNELNDFDKLAVARVIEQSARMADDNEKLTAQTQDIIDLIRESNFWAEKENNDIVTADDVQKAIDQQIYRSGRLRDRIQESILRKNIFIDTEGSKVGQVNGLSFLNIGNLNFGMPSRITASIQLGKGDVINIEREVEMSGPIHSKGVLILTGFLGARYAVDKPLSLNASLVFEQSYSGVDGDSASSTELYALLSAIGEIPIRQQIAVTGSVNQHGQIQPIGGVNEKIEGFFDICNQRGLTGEQGVLIPDTNIKNLMLRQNVINAVKDKKFHIYPLKTVDQGMEILTGMPMGQPDEHNQYPRGSVNFKVMEKLNLLAERRRKFGAVMNGRKK